LGFGHGHPVCARLWSAVAPPVPTGGGLILLLVFRWAFVWCVSQISCILTLLNGHSCELMNFPAQSIKFSRSCIRSLVHNLSTAISARHSFQSNRIRSSLGARTETNNTYEVRSACCQTRRCRYPFLTLPVVLFLPFANLASFLGPLPLVFLFSVLDKHTLYRG
jgi:hypothetical protein